jgi:hypothetical protein
VLKAEFTQRNNECDESRKKIAQLEKENRLLIQRWLDYKNAEARYTHTRTLTRTQAHARAQTARASVPSTPPSPCHAQPCTRST